MSGYTPSEEEVRDAWCAFMTEPFGYWDALDDAEADARFNRFLAEDRRKTAAKVLRDHRRRVARLIPPGLVSRGTVLADLDDYADRIEKGASDDDAG